MQLTTIHMSPTCTGPITIIRGSERVKDSIVPDFEGNVIDWQLAADYDRLTGLTYFASWRVWGDDGR